VKHKRNLSAVLLVIIAGFAALSCQPEEPFQSQKNNPPRNLYQQLSDAMHSTAIHVGAPVMPQAGDFNLLADRLHIRAIRDSELLNTAIGNFLTQTNHSNLRLARRAWHQAHTSLTSLWLVYQADPLWRLLRQAKPHSAVSLLDAAPLLPGYLDSIPGYPNSGLVAALDIPVNYASLAALHQHADREFVVLGLHPLEYFLWTGVKPLLADSPGNSPEGIAIRQILNERRHKLVKLIGEAYREQLVTMHSQWHKQGYGQFYADNQSGSATTYAHPVLAATINYLDRFITHQLEVNPDTNNYLFTDHFQFSQDASSAWRGINSAIIQLAGLNKLSAPLITDTSEALLNCLLRLQPVHVTRHKDSKTCQKELRDLKQTILMSYNQSNQ